MFVRPTQLVFIDDAGNPIEDAQTPDEKPRSRLSRLVVRGDDSAKGIPIPREPGTSGREESQCSIGARSIQSIQFSSSLLIQMFCTLRSTIPCCSHVSCGAVPNYLSLPSFSSNTPVTLLSLLTPASAKRATGRVT